MQSKSLVSLILAATALAPAQTPTTPSPYNQPFRPQIHFSPAQHWTNDPNGLVFFAGEYHLFFQYNPLGDTWGHMSWGHAVSPDLLHWKELPVAIPEAQTPHGKEMAFTGSVVIDEANTSGLCTPHTACMVAVYTAHSGYDQHPEHINQAQNLAASQDHGRTWTRFSGNPVLDLHLADFRDPAVTWQPAQHRWLMAVSLPKEHKVRFYGSPDLKHWTPLSDFGPLGDTAGDWECPDLVELPRTQNTPTTYALKVGLNPGAPQGGSGEQYFLGTFDGTRFTPSPEPGAHGYTNYGKDDYCAINFNHLPPAGGTPAEPILLGWMSNWDYAAKLPTAPWRGQMSLPRRLSLIHDTDGLALSQHPVTEPLRANHQVLTSPASVQTARQSIYTGTSPAELALQFTPTPASNFTLRLRSDETHYTEITFDLPHHQLTLDRTHSGLSVAPNFPGVTHAPLAIHRPLDLRLVLDRSSLELYAQDGTVAMTDLLFPPTANLRLELISAGPEPVRYRGEAWSLHSIWTPAEIHHELTPALSPATRPSK